MTNSIAAIEAEPIQFIELNNSYNKKLYDQNTDINAHSDNLVLLALLGSSDVLLQAAQEYHSSLKRFGYLTEELREFDNALRSRLKVKKTEVTTLPRHENHYGYWTCDGELLESFFRNGERYIRHLMSNVDLPNYKADCKEAQSKIIEGVYKLGIYKK